MLARAVGHSQPGSRVGRLSARAASIANDHAGQYFYLGPDKALTRLTDGHFLYVDPRDDTVCAHLIARGYWETWILKVVRSLVKPGDHVIDVGANVGYYTIALAHQVGATGSVTALEANSNLTRLLRQSVIFNGYSPTVTVLTKAASDRPGVLQFASSSSNAGGGHIFAFEDALGIDTIVEEVEAVTLDSLDVPSPKLIRIDAEGSEALILKGAQRLLSRRDVVICMEWDVIQIESRSDVSEIIEWLTSQSFRFWRINGDASLKELRPDELPHQPGCDLLVSRAPPPGAI